MPGIVCWRGLRSSLSEGVTLATMLAPVLNDSVAESNCFLIFCGLTVSRTPPIPSLMPLKKLPAFLPNGVAKSTTDDSIISSDDEAAVGLTGPTKSSPMPVIPLGTVPGAPPVLVILIFLSKTFKWSVNSTTVSPRLPKKPTKPTPKLTIPLKKLVSLLELPLKSTRPNVKPSIPLTISSMPEDIPSIPVFILP